MEQTKTSKLVSVLLAFVLSFSMLGTASLGIFADTAYADDETPDSIYIVNDATSKQAVSQLVLFEGENTYTVTPMVYNKAGEDITKKVAVSYESSDVNIASIDSTGLITAKKAADSPVTITAKCVGYENVSTTYTVYVNDFVFLTPSQRNVVLNASNNFVKETFYNSDFYWGNTTKRVDVDASGNGGVDGTKVKVSYRVTDESVAIFDDETMTLTGKGPGTTTLIATVNFEDEDGQKHEGMVAKSAITVANPPTGVRIPDSTSRSLVAGGSPNTHAVNATVTYDTDAVELGIDRNPDTVFTWSSQDEGIVTVTPAGDMMSAIVTAVNPGSTTVTFAAESRSSNFKQSVTAAFTVNGLGISKTALNFTADNIGTAAAPLAVTLYKDSSTESSLTGVTWKSSNETVATVDSSGQVTPHETGTATITATYKNTKVNPNITYTATCLVTVSNPVASVEVTQTEPKAADIPSGGYAIGDKGTVVAKLYDGKSTPEELTLAQAGGTVRWVSTDPSVVAIVGDGVEASFEVIKAGTTEIYAVYKSGVEGAEDIKSTDTATSGKDKVTVTANGFTIDPSIVTLSKDQMTEDLTANNYTNKTPTNVPSEWAIEEGDSVVRIKASSDKKTAIVTAIGGGTAVVTAQYRDTATGVVRTATCEVTVENPATAITVDPTQVTLDQGATSQLTASTEGPLGKDTKVTDTITWASSDEKIATVDENGLVTAVAAGSATITATAGNVSATCAVTVNAVEPDSVTMYRLYNPNSGEHFFTVNPAERDMLVNAGWDEEDNGAPVPTSGKAVYRLYNENGGEHHYTLDEGEVAALVKAGWTDEGVAFYSADETGTPMYRVYNPNAYANNHHYTPDVNEKNYLVTIGWKGEGIGWYGV